MKLKAQMQKQSLDPNWSDWLAEVINNDLDSDYITPERKNEIVRARLHEITKAIDAVFEKFALMQNLEENWNMGFMQKLDYETRKKEIEAL